MRLVSNLSRILLITVLWLGMSACETVVSQSGNNPGISPGTLIDETESGEDGISVSADGTCILSSLTSAVTWDLALSEIQGRISLSNYTGSDCSLDGPPQLAIINGSGERMAVDLQYHPDAQIRLPIMLESNSFAAAVADFNWRNWCGAVLDGSGVYFEISLPDHYGTTRALVQDPHGRPLDETPACVDEDSTSVLEVGVFRIVSP